LVINPRAYLRLSFRIFFFTIRDRTMLCWFNFAVKLFDHTQFTPFKSIRLVIICQLLFSSGICRKIYYLTKPNMISSKKIQTVLQWFLRVINIWSTCRMKRRSRYICHAYMAWTYFVEISSKQLIDWLGMKAAIIEN